jgi:transcriptional regulator with XRE-family HTH domain
MSRDQTDLNVGSRVRSCRRTLDMSQGHLADALGIAYQQVQKYETGANRIGASRLQQIAQILKVQVSFFFEGATALRVVHDAPPLSEFVAEFLATPDGRALMRAFMRIRDKTVRRRIRNLVEGIADDIEHSTNHRKSKRGDFPR